MRCPRRFLAAFVCLAIIAPLVGCSSGTADEAELAPTAVPGDSAVVSTVDVEPVLLGVRADRGIDETPRDAVEIVDAAAGRQIDLVRVDFGWESDFPTRDVVDLVAEGRSIFVVIHPIHRDGTPVRWDDIAKRRASEIADLDRWAEALVSTPGVAMVAFHPSPDLPAQGAEGDYGRPEDFVSAWLAFVDALASADSEGAQEENEENDARAQTPEMVWVASDEMLRSGDVDSWYPGDDAVDMIGVEAYNNASCAPDPATWQSPRQLLSPLVAFGSRHPNKPLVAAAFGSVEDPANPARKAEWFGSIASALAAPELAPIDAVVIHHGADLVHPLCEWWVDTSVAASSAFGVLATDPIVGGDQAEPATVRCARIEQHQSLAGDGAAVDIDRDGLADLYFGRENHAVGVGEEGADGREQRVLLPFGTPENAPVGEERVILRVRLLGSPPRNASPVRLSVLDSPDPVSARSFDAPATPIDLEFMSPNSLPGYYQIDVTDYITGESGVVFRLELVDPPALDGAGDPYQIVMADEAVTADRPTLEVRSC